MTRAIGLLAALLCAPLPAAAHPHIFVDTALRLIVDDAGQATGVEVRWTYDAHYSRLTFEDMALDRDQDGTLDAAELTQLEGFDMRWIAGFAGDTYLWAGERPVPLGPPQPVATDVSDGMITSVHIRSFDPLPPDALVLKAFDPEYYTYYALEGGVEVPDSCQAEVDAADTGAAERLLASLLGGRDPEMVVDFPKVGAAFADTVHIRCADPS